MAKKRHRKAHSRPERDSSHITSERLLRPPLPIKEPLRHDRRLFDPTGKFPRDIYGFAGRMVVKKSLTKNNRLRYNEIRWENPKLMEICRRRKERKETLFALKKIGKGKGGPKERRLTEYSKVVC